MTALLPRVAVVIVLVLMGVTALLARPASAAMVECPPMGSGTCKQLQPVAECYWRNGTGSTTIVWGWDNPTSDTAVVAVGSHNRVSPGGDDQGQPTVFAPGRHTNAFVTTSGSEEMSWRLGNRTAEVEIDDDEVEDLRRCATKPVSQVGNVGALLLGVLAAVVTGLLVVVARPRRLVVTP